MTETDDIVVTEKPGDGPDRRADAGRARPSSDLQASPAMGNARPSLQDHTLVFESKMILKALAYCIVAIIALHLLTMVANFGFGYDRLYGLVHMFSLEAEKNVPTLFSSVQLLIGAFLLGICAARKKAVADRFYKHWIGLSAIFIFLAVDESALIHEKTANVLRDVLGTSGLLYYAWVIPFGLFALAVLAAYSRFLFSLPRGTALVFVASGALFVTGAVGMELFEGRISEAGGYNSLDYMALVTVEEIMEITGIFAFVYGLLAYMTASGHPLKLALAK